MGVARLEEKRAAPPTLDDLPDASAATRTRLGLGICTRLQGIAARMSPAKGRGRSKNENRQVRPEFWTDEKWRRPTRRVCFTSDFGKSLTMRAGWTGKCIELVRCCIPTDRFAARNREIEKGLGEATCRGIPG